MPYLEPAHVLGRFSEFAREEIRPALADDERFVSAQVGSMASTLNYLAAELEGHDAAVETQREALLDALDVTEDVLAESEASGTTHALDVVRESRTRVSDVDLTTDARAVEDEILAAADEALTAIDEIENEDADAARRPLYGFLDARLDEQLRLLGRTDE